ncbi:glycosyltransferase [Patescibacteria group bacterium]|nr:glycosyltransferase [Patescibacteria group bacterium]
MSVVLPVFSERKSIVQIIEWLRANCREYLHEIIIVLAPQSDQETKNICQDMVARYGVKIVIQNNLSGLGQAYRQGFLSATGSHLLMLDSNGEMGLDSIPEMVVAARRGCQVVIGSRWMSGGGVSGYDPFKYFLNRAFQVIFRIIYRTSIHDLTLGYKLLEQGVAHNINWEGDRHEFATETTLKPIHLGLKVCEVPTNWTRRKEGRSKNKFSDNFRYFSMTWHIKRQRPDDLFRSSTEPSPQPVPELD